MRDLVENMCHDDPAKRPCMREVEQRFAQIQSQLDEWKLASRLADRDEFFVMTVVRGMPHTAGQVGSFLRKRFFG
jgi:hypothetical protein